MDLKSSVKSKNDNKTRYSDKFELGKIDWEKMEKIFIRDKGDYLKKWEKDIKISPKTKEILTILAGRCSYRVIISFSYTSYSSGPFFS